MLCHCWFGLLDYSCSMLASLPANSISRLQSVLNAAARLVFSSRKHVTTVCRHFFNDCIGWRWSSGLSTSLLYLCIAVSMDWHHRTSPRTCSLFQVLSHSDDCDQQPPMLLSFHRLVSPLSVIGLFQLPRLKCGTAAQHVQAAAENWTFHSLLWPAVLLCTQTFYIGSNSVLLLHNSFYFFSC